MTGYAKLDQDLKLFSFDEKYVHICFLAEWSSQTFLKPKHTLKYWQKFLIKFYGFTNNAAPLHTNSLLSARENFYEQHSCGSETQFKICMAFPKFCLLLQIL